jgi:hypothetical protein
MKHRREEKSRNYQEHEARVKREDRRKELSASSVKFTDRPHSTEKHAGVEESVDGALTAGEHEASGPYNQGDKYDYTAVTDVTAESLPEFRPSKNWLASVLVFEM